jgi:hypothetical protein
LVKKITFATSKHFIMKKITLLFLAMTLMAALPSKAQMGSRIPTANLTIFSEDGAKFYLELNGERYNDIAQTNVRIEELPNPYYSCKVIFEDPAIPALTKKTLDVADMDGIMQDVTYRIKTNKQGKRSLNFFSNIPAEQNMMRPPNTPVYQYGRPNHMIVDARGVVVTEQVTVQQTVATPGIGMNVNMGGVAVNVNMPVMGMETTMTTTTTTSSSGGFIDDSSEDFHDDDRRGGCRRPMDTRDFEDAKSTIAASKFDDTRLSLAKQIISGNCMNTNQVLAIVKLFSFEESKLDFAKHAYGYCMEKNNYFKVVNAFTFDSSKNELNNYIQQQR